MSRIIDSFDGDTEALKSSIRVLIELNDKGALTPHGIGTHARNLLAAAYHRLPSAMNDKTPQ